jgi:hypothetical protein
MRMFCGAYGVVYGSAGVGVAVITPSTEVVPSSNCAARNQA